MAANMELNMILAYLKYGDEFININNLKYLIVLNNNDTISAAITNYKIFLAFTASYIIFPHTNINKHNYIL